MYYTYNTDPTYYYKYSGMANCGSFALRLNEWYDPEDDCDVVYDWITEMALEYNNDEISDIYADILIERILDEFKDEIEISDGTIPTEENIELIAFATFCYYDEEEDNCNWDFHFKVYRDNIWQQKCGCLKPEFCELEEWGKYTSHITFLYHKINKGE